MTSAIGRPREATSLDLDGRAVAAQVAADVAAGVCSPSQLAAGRIDDQRLDRVRRDQEAHRVGDGAPASGLAFQPIMTRSPIVSPSTRWG